MTNKKTTRFSVTIYDTGAANDHLLNLVASHNGGKITASLQEMATYVKRQKQLLPALYKTVEVFEREYSIEVWEDDHCRLMIEETEHYELSDAADPQAEANGFVSLADG